MFNDAVMAYNILKLRGTPLSIHEIVKLALQEQWYEKYQVPMDDMLYTSLLIDINLYQEASMFLQVGPRLFDINPDYNPDGNQRHEVSEFLDIITVSIEKQTTILEHSICDIINFYNHNKLKCWKESEYDGGIEILIEEIGKDSPGRQMSVQLRACIGTQPTWYGIFVANSTLDPNADFQLFCYFDINEAALWRFVWLIPTADFLNHAPVIMNEDSELCRCFFGGLRSSQSVVWEEYMMTKRNLPSALYHHIQNLPV